MESKNILMIDGSYIGHRSMYSLGKTLSRDVLLDTQEEMMQFEDQLFNDIVTIARTFKANVDIDNVLFFVDGKSWRHKPEKIRPYYESETKLLGYKENRKKTKEKSKVDWDNYHMCLDENVVAKLNGLDGFHSSCDEGFEADDNIYLSAKYFSEQGHNVFIFANDGDHEQSVINNNVYYFCNTKSKELPIGKILVNSDLLAPTKINMSGIEILQHKIANGNNIKTKTLEKLSKIEIGNTYIGNKIRNVENNFVQSSKPLFFGFVKAIIGDKKDNILPIIGRFSASGRLTRVLEKHIIIAFDGLRTSFENDKINKKTSDNELTLLLLSDFNDSNDASKLSAYSVAFLKSLIIQLKEQKTAKNVFNHLKLNIDLMMLCMLDSSDISETYEENVLPNIINNLNLNINLDNINNKVIKQNHDILIESIPDIVTENNEENTEENNKSASTQIDDILNSALDLKL